MPEIFRKITTDDVEMLIRFIENTVKRAGCDGVVVGLSGGLDSAVVTKLCVDALGAENVLNIFMPTVITPADDYRQTMELSKLWGTEYKVVDVQPAVDAFTGMLFSKIKAPLERGNISARCRMVVLYNSAKKNNRLVVGTSNRSELMMGYFTKFGDGACDLVPMVDLYKTQVRQLAEIVGVPREIIDKTPTAGLWEGQTDEEEMGITYRDLDIVLECLRKGMSDDEISEITKLSLSKVAEIREQTEAMSHKRFPPLRPDWLFD